MNGVSTQHLRINFFNGRRGNSVSKPYIKLHRNAGTASRETNCPVARVRKRPGETILPIPLFREPAKSSLTQLEPMSKRQSA